MNLAEEQEEQRRPLTIKTNVAKAPSQAPGEAVAAPGPAQEKKYKIEVSNLSFWFGEKQALNDVSLRIAEKEVTAIIGPSGCGKSTLIRTFNRMYENTAGARVQGRVF